MRSSFITATDPLLMVNVFAEPLIFFFFAPDRSCAAGVKARTSSPTLIRPWLMLPRHCLKKKKGKHSWKTKGNPTIAFSISPLALLWSHSISRLIFFFFFFVDKHPRATLKSDASFPFDFLPPSGWRFYSPRDSVLQPLKGSPPSARVRHRCDLRRLPGFHSERRREFSTVSGPRILASDLLVAARRFYRRITE